MLTRVLRGGVDEVPAPAWDRLVGAASPFLEHAYLRACERGSATAEQGIEPRHVTLWRGDELVAAAPLYLKHDGRAEFVYDFEWYSLARRLRAPYYPKLVSMAPFAPFEVPHLLGPSDVRASLLDAVDELAAREVHGVHWLFVGDEDTRALEARGGLVRRTTLSLVWRNDGWTSFEHYLSALRSKARVRTRREVRRVEEAGLEVERVEGDAIGAADLRLLRDYYERTCELHGTGSDYLKPPTWEALLGWRRRLVLFFARRGGRRVGGSLLVQHGADLYGRYWGAERDEPFLYFTLCFYRPIAHAIERGLQRVHAGAGTTFHKFARGFAPARVTSFHRVRDARLQQGIAASAAQEARALEAALRT